MSFIILMILFSLLVTVIYQSRQLNKLKRQTIEAFKKMCEKVFEDNINDIR